MARFLPSKSNANLEKLPRNHKMQFRYVVFFLTSLTKSKCQAGQWVYDPFSSLCDVIPISLRKNRTVCIKIYT